jgi:hypothetical protein
MEICLNQLYDGEVRKGQAVIDKNVTAFTSKKGKTAPRKDLERI